MYFVFLGSISCIFDFAGAGAIEIVGTPLGIIYSGVPTVAGRTAIVTPLHERRDHLAFSFCRGFLECVLGQWPRSQARCRSRLIALPRLAAGVQHSKRPWAKVTSRNTA